MVRSIHWPSAARPPPCDSARSRRTRGAAMGRTAAREPATGTSFSIFTHALGRRYAAVALEAAGLPFSQIRSHVKGVSKSRLKAWRVRFERTGDLSTAVRAKKPPSSVSARALAATQRALQSGGKGKLPQQSLRRAHVQLKASGKVKVDRTTLARALAFAGWSNQPVKRKIELSPRHVQARLAFVRTEGRRIASDTIFTDSKIFEGAPTNSTRLGSAWAPNGEPVEIPVVKSTPFKVHVYAGVCLNGATPLFETKGTYNPPGRGRGRGGRGRGRARNAQPHAPNAQPASKGVDAIEYRRVLDDSNGRGLLAEADKLFNGQAYRYQQDGAKAHSIADTDIGRATRALIETHARLVEPWPALSPDLSPIEKAWSAAEHHLWATKNWTTMPEFKAAVHASWSEVVTPAYCRALFRGVRATYATCQAVGGKQIRGWGRTVVACRSAEDEGDQE